jgi:hypothetical protein
MRPSVMKVSGRDISAGREECLEHEEAGKEDVVKRNLGNGAI